VEARGISVSLGAAQVLDDVSVSLDAGRALMLVGPNGAGKSTLMKVLLGLVRPDFARFEVDGERRDIDNEWKSHIGYLPEAVAFSENLSGRQLLQFFARARGVHRERIDAVLERVGLTVAGRRSIRGYSRGMRQRLGLGVAILSNPDLLILDEPTAGLDQEGLSVLWSIIAEWRDAGRMLLASTHDLALMERRTDSICVLQGGRVRALGSAEDLRRAAGLPHRIWLTLSNASDTKVPTLCEVLGRWGHGNVELVGDRIRVDLPADDVLELMKLQSGFPGLVIGVRVEEPTLDLIYSEILGAA
jgi:Cu-processing system ATP-binding protein